MLSLLAVTAVLSAVAAEVNGPFAARSKQNRRVLHDPRFLRSTGERSFSYFHEHLDMLGGLNHYSYDVKVHAHVTNVDTNTHITGITCDDKSAMTILLNDARAAEFWKPQATILTGHSEAFKCRYSPDEEPSPFARSIEGVEHIAIKLRSSEDYTVFKSWKEVPWLDLKPDSPAIVKFITKEAGPENCFENIRINYYRRPGQREAELEDAMASNATLRAELRKLNWLSAAGSFVSNAVGSVVNTVVNTAKTVVNVGTAVVQVASTAVTAAANGGVWGDNKRWEYELLNWQYNSRAKAPYASKTDLLGGNVYCQNCYAYVGGWITFSFEMKWADLQRLEVSATGLAAAGVDIQVQLPGPYQNSKTTSIVPRKRMGNVEFNVAGVPIRINLDGAVDVVMEASAKAKGSVVGPGFKFERSITLGVKYDKSNGWKIINDRTSIMEARKPSIDIQGSLFAKVTPRLTLIFSLWSSWDLTVMLEPYMSAQLDFSVSSSSCAANSAALTMKVGMDGSLRLDEPVITISPFGAGPWQLKIPGAGNIFPITGSFQLSAGVTLSGQGLSGCVIASSITGSAAMSYNSYATPTALPTRSVAPSSSPRAPLVTATRTPTRLPATPSPSRSPLARASPTRTPSATRSRTPSPQPADDDSTSSSSSSSAYGLIGRLANSFWGRRLQDANQRPLELSANQQEALQTMAEASEEEPAIRQLQASQAYIDANCAAACSDATGGTAGCLFTAGTYGTCGANVIYDTASSCGLFRQSRSVSCRSRNGNGPVIPDVCCGTQVKPVTEQDCEVTAGCPTSFNGVNFATPFYLGGGRFDFSVVPSSYVVAGALNLGAKPSYGNSFYFDWSMPSKETAVSVELRPLFGWGDPDLTVQDRSITSSVTLSSAKFNSNPDLVLMTTEENPSLAQGSTLRISVDTYAPSPRDPTRSSAQFTLSVRPFVPLVASKPYASTCDARIFGRAAGVPAVRYFRFRPDVDADGVMFDIRPMSSVDTGKANIFISTSDDGFPTQQNARWSTTTNNADEKSIYLSSAEHVKESVYTIAVICSPGQAASFDIQAAEVRTLQAGTILHGIVPYRGLQYFTYTAQDRDSYLNILLEPTHGDCDLLVGRSVFTKRPFWPSYGPLDCPFCLWVSAYDDLVVETVSVSHLNPRFGKDYFIAVSGYAAGGFRISAQSYEKLDEGAVVTRGQPPQSYAYYLGRAATDTGDVDEDGVSFNANIALGDKSPGSVTLLAGSKYRFWPAVYLGFEGLIASDIKGTEVGKISKGYLAGSDVARQMILGVRSGYHGVSLAETAPSSRGLSSIPEDISSLNKQRALSAPAGRRSYRFSPSEVIRGFTGEEFTGNDPADIQNEVTPEGGLGRITTQEARVAAYESTFTGSLVQKLHLPNAIEAARNFVQRLKESLSPQQAASFLTQAGVDAASFNLTQLIEGDESSEAFDDLLEALTRPLQANEESVPTPVSGNARALSSEDRVLLSTVFHPSVIDILPEHICSAAIDRIKNPQGSEPHDDAVLRRTADVLPAPVAFESEQPVFLPPGSRSALALTQQAGASHSRRLATSIADPSLLLAADSSAGMSVTMFRFNALAWEMISDCDLNNIYSPGDACVRVTGSAQENIFVRVRVPPRTAIIFTMVSAQRQNTDGSPAPLDAAYAITFSADAPSDGSTASSSQAMAVSSPLIASGASFRVANCKYVARDYFLTVKGANADNRPIAFDSFVDGLSSDSLICPTYVWQATPWSSCDATCGKGVQKRVVFCADLEGGKVVSDEMCPRDSKLISSKTCDVGACQWVSSDWSICSQPCGPSAGSQRRLVTCQNGNGVGPVVADVHCVSANKPDTTQPCNQFVCPTYYWYTDGWSACSKPCGGGTQKRNVQCRKGVNGAPSTTDLPPYNCESVGAAPSATRSCNTRPCADVTYSLVSYETRRLVSGIPRTETLAPGQQTFYTYQKPNAGAKGVCVVVTPRAPKSQVCTLDAERQAAMCLNSLTACVEAANEADTAAAVMLRAAPGGSGSFAGVPVYPKLTQWRAAGTDSFATSNSSCQCFAKAQDCLSNVVCSPDIAASQSAVEALCKRSTVCNFIKSTVAPTAPSTCSTLPVKRVFGASTAPGTVSVFLRKNRMTDLSSNPMIPPTSLANSEWGGSGSIEQGEKRMVIYDESYTSSDADELLVGMTAQNNSATVTISMTSLSAFPVSYEGTLVSSSGVTAAQIRQGGLTLVISLSCDAFIAPADALLSIPSLASSATARAEAGSRLGPNIVALGIVADESYEMGWNRVARPALLSPTAATFAAFSYGMTRLTITLPPIPNYAPSSDETIRVAIPASMLNSGVTTPLQDLAIKVAADTADCQVSAWSAWSPCSETCKPGVTTRTRVVTRVREGIAASCPTTVETRPCNTCDSCSGVTCSGNGAFCAMGRCVCPPGFAGADCSLPASTTATTFWRAGPWSTCSRFCDGGVSTREVTCMTYSRGTVAPAIGSAEDCKAAGLSMPETKKACNIQACAEKKLDLVLPLRMPYTSLAISNGMVDGATGALANELASVLSISVLRVIITSAAPGAIAPLRTAIGSNNSIATYSLHPLWQFADRPADAALWQALWSLVTTVPGADGNVTFVNATILPPSAVVLAPASTPAATASGSSGSSSRLRRVELVGAPIDAVKAALQAGTTPGSPFQTTGSILPKTELASAKFQTVSGIRGDVVEAGVLSAPPSSSSAATSGSGSGGGGTVVGGGSSVQASPSPGTAAAVTNANGGSSGENGGTNNTLVVVLAVSLGLVASGLAVAGVILIVRRTNASSVGKLTSARYPVNSDMAIPSRTNPLAPNPASRASIAALMPGAVSSVAVAGQPAANTPVTAVTNPAAGAVPNHTRQQNVAIRATSKRARVDEREIAEAEAGNGSGEQRPSLVNLARKLGSKRFFSPSGTASGNNSSSAKA